MARQFNSASSQYLELAPAVVTAAPLTIAAWFRPASATATYNLINIGDTSGNNYFNVYLNVSSLSATVGAASQDASTDRTAETTTTYTANRWHHACAVYASTTSRAAYLNGGGKGTEGTSSVPASIAQVDIGGYHVGASVFGAFNGQIAEVAVWNVDLSDAEVAILAGLGGGPLAGLPLRVRPANLVAYWPLLGEAGPELNLARTGFARNIAAVNGPIVVPHPDFLLPEARPRARPRGLAAAAAGGNSLLTSLSAYWKLDEASGNAVDALGSNDLTDNGACGTASGVVSTARTFDGSTQSLSHATNSTFAVGDIDVTFAAWVYLTDKTAVRTILSRRDSDAAAIQYVLRYVNTSDRFTFFVSSDGTAGATGGASANNFGSPSLSTWYHVVAWHDSVNNQVGISVNAGAPDLVSYSAGIFDTTASFRVGATGIGENWAGRLDEVGYWKRALTATDRSALYNGGAGRAYSTFGTGAASATFVVSASLAPVALAASLTTTAPASSAATLAATLANVALTSSFTSAAPAASSIAVAPTLGAVALASTFTATAAPASSFSASATLAAMSLAASLAAAPPAASAITLAPALAGVALASSFTAPAAGVSSITLAPTLAAATLSATLTTTAPAASSFSATPTLAGVTLAASLASTAPGSSSITVAPTLAAVALSSSFTATAPASSAIAIAPTLAPVALTSSFTTVAPSSSSFSAAATLANVALASSFSANTVGSCSFSAAPTLAPVALSSTLATTTPAASSFSAAATLAAVTLASTFTAGASGATTFAVAGTIPTTLAATLATTQPAASALRYAATLANVAFSALLAASGPPGPTSMALAATLASVTANLHLIASGGVVTAGRHPDAGRSTGVRLGPDPSRSQGRRLGPDPSRSTGSVT